MLVGCAFAAQAGAEEPPSDLQAGMAAYQKGDFKAAIASLQKPAGTGDQDALFYLGEAVFFNTARAGNLGQAFKLYKLGADAGDARAWFRLAEMQVMGITGPTDVNAALTSLRRAADAGFEPAGLARTQLFKARALAREWSSRIKASDLVVQNRPDLADTAGSQFGIFGQASCAEPREAALLSQVGNLLYERFTGDALWSYYNKLPDQVTARPLLAPFYAHVIESDRALFKSCSISQGLPRDSVTTGDTIDAYGLTELKIPKGDEEERFWLLPSPTDTVGMRLGAQTGPGYFSAGPGVLYGCPRAASEQIVNAVAIKPDLIKPCVALQYGLVAATGRSLKVSKSEANGQVSAQWLPEVAVLGQFGKALYLNQVQVAPSQ